MRERWRVMVISVAMQPFLLSEPIGSFPRERHDRSSQGGSFKNMT
jgi:hypothetical protein